MVLSWEDYPLQPQLQPLGQLHDEPCPHEQPRIKITLSAGPAFR